MAAPYTTFHFLDHSNEHSSLKMYLPDITSANYAATLASLGDMRNAIGALTLCTMGATPELVSEVHTDVATIPTSPYAQREQRAMFECADSQTGRRFKIGVPCPDLDDLGLPRTDEINFTNADVIDYLAALASHALSPEGNAFTVIRGRVEGRNV